jgi:hypothetical protein
MSDDLIQWDTLLVDQLGRTEDTIYKLAIQNYAASGAVLAAYLTFGDQKFPRWLALLIVLLFALNFTLAIASHLWRFKALYRIHRITVDAALEMKSRKELNEILRKDDVARLVLETKTLSLSDYNKRMDFRHLVIGANLIPGLGTLLLFLFT